jgi:YfiH family protein
MPFVEKNGLKYYQFPGLPEIATHAVFTRRGGVSTEPCASLNVGGSVGDDPANVRVNRIRAFETLERDPASVFDVWQVHGARTSYAVKPRDPNTHEDKADIIFTDRPDVTLYMRFAGCTPLLFVDPVKRVVGLAHAGWQGTVKNVAGAAVNAMRERYGSTPKDIYAAIGPAIGPDHYEVGENVIEAVRESFGADADALLPRVGERRHFDLWAANHLQLSQAGIEHIESAELCTACHTDDWFSHRQERGKTGRFGVLMGLKG